MTGPQEAERPKELVREALESLREGEAAPPHVVTAILKMGRAFRILLAEDMDMGGRLTRPLALGMLADVDRLLEKYKASWYFVDRGGERADVAGALRYGLGAVRTQLADYFEDCWKEAPR